MQNFNSLRVSSLMKATNSVSSKFAKSLVKTFSFPISAGMRETLKFQKNKTASQALANDWKKIGKDMGLGVIKYDRQLTEQQSNKSSKSKIR